ncbi:MAG: hypothetical protein JSS74_11160 [Actinobacteria bacterium]|nr:hypothetical protein [Actinomycetota bacterium]
MRQLDEGLYRVAEKYGRSVVLLEEDPETFGAGHYVFYPSGHAQARFAIEEQYAPGIGWSDPDRVPTSWLWRAEHITRRPDGRHAWTAEAFGEVDSADYSALLTTADRWARRISHDTTSARAVTTAVRRPPAPRR